MKKKLISVLTAACLFVTAAVSGGEPVFAVTTSGNCGAVGNESSVTWQLDGDTLTISGNGAMMDYYSVGDEPWHDVSSSITKIIIGEGVTNIGENAFYGYDSLETVTFSNTVESIGRCAFMECSNLKSPTFPPSIKTIGQQAFANCDSFDKLVLTGVTEIGYYAFQECSAGEFSYDIDELSRCKGLKSVSMPELTYMDRYAFSRCFNLESVSMPVLETIGNGAFSNCRMLKSINMPKVTKIGNYAFMGNPSLEILVIENVVTMGKQSFVDSSNATIFIPPNCTYKDDTFNSGTVVVEYTVTNDETPLKIIRAYTDKVHFPEFIGGGKVISSNWEWYKAQRPRGKITHDGEHNLDENSTCQICGEKIHIHVWGEWVTDPAYHERTCEKFNQPGGCSYMDGGYEYESHFSYYEQVYENAPTCMEEGNEWGQYCTKCGYVQTEPTPIPALGHDVENQEWQFDDEQHWKICSRCGDEVDKANHRWDGGEITAEPPATTDGVKTYTCTVCQATKTESTPATGTTDNPNSPDQGDSGSSGSENNTSNAAEEVQTGENAPKAELITPLDQILDIVLTDSEKTEDQDDAKIVLSIEDGTNKISPEDKAKVEAAIEKIEGCKLGQYLDVSLIKIIGENQERITETSVPIRVSFALPEALLGDNRVFSAISVYDGEIEILHDLDDNDKTITLEIDKFLELVLIYEEVILSHSPELPDTNPTTGILLSVIPAAASLSIIALSKRKNK